MSSSINMYPNDPKIKIEPFNLFGVSSTIWNVEDARKVVKANSYYFYVIVVITLLQYLNQVLNDLHTEYERNVLLAYALLILTLTVLVRLKMNRIAAILLLANFSWNFFNAILNAIHSFLSQAEFASWGVIFMSLMVAASYRTVRGTFAYSGFIKIENTANNRMQPDAAKLRR